MLTYGKWSYLKQTAGKPPGSVGPVGRVNNQSTRVDQAWGLTMALHRRHFISSSITTATCVAFSPISRALAARVRKPNSMAEWMDAWTGEKARDPEGALFVYRFKEPMWALLKPIAWRPDPGTSKIERVEAPMGFVTDFASIPRAFYSLLRPD